MRRAIGKPPFFLDKTMKNVLEYFCFEYKQNFILNWKFWFLTPLIFGLWDYPFFIRTVYMKITIQQIRIGPCSFVAKIKKFASNLSQRLYLFVTRRTILLR